MGINKNVIGNKYNRLTVLNKYKKNKAGNTSWLCLCICGNKKYVYISNLTTGHTQSCGCIAKENTIKRNYKHGFTNTRFLSIWNKMKNRIYNKKCKSYKDYGGRGIKIDWDNFIDFKKDMYKSYLHHVKKYGEEQTTIERINNNKNYSKENCRWATKLEQANNKRNNKMITHQGKTRTLAQWCRILGIPYNRTHIRLQNKASTEKAFKK